MRTHLGTTVRIWLVLAFVVLTSCAERQAKDVLELELSQPGRDQLISIEVPVQACGRGVVTAYEEPGDSWRIQLELERGIEVAVFITSPNGERLLGVLEEAEQLFPGFSGSGTAELRPEGDPNADPSTAQMSWLCD